MRFLPTSLISSLLSCKAFSSSSLSNTWFAKSNFLNGLISIKLERRGSQKLSLFSVCFFSKRNCRRLRPCLIYFFEPRTDWMIEWFDEAIVVPVFLGFLSSICSSANFMKREKEDEFFVCFEPEWLVDMRAASLIFKIPTNLLYFFFSYSMMSTLISCMVAPIFYCLILLQSLFLIILKCS